MKEVKVNGKRLNLIPIELIGFLFRHSRRALLLAVGASAASGLLTASLLALISDTLNQDAGRRTGTTVLLFALLALAVPATRFLSTALLVQLGQAAVYSLRMLLSRRILAAPIRQLEQLGSHRLLAALTDDVGSCTTAVSLIPALGMNLAMVFGCGAYLAWVSWRILVLLVLFSVVGYLTYRRLARIGTDLMARSRSEYDLLYRHFRDLTDGTKELKLHASRSEAFLNQMKATALGIQGLGVRSVLAFAGTNAFSQALFFALVGLLIFVGGLAGNVDQKALSSYVLILLYMINPLQGMLNILPQIARAGVAIQRVEGLGLSLLQSAEGGETVPAAAARSFRRVELREVIFTLGEGEKESFRLGPVDLVVEPAEIVFVTGGNGSGKTTLAKILTGLYVPDSGHVLLDGEEVGERDRPAFRELFSAVFSEGYVFDQLLGLEGTEHETEAQRLLELLRLDRVMKLEGSRFSRTDLSRGEHKRLALLTACLEDRPLYLLDEWAADQDPEFRKSFYEEILPMLKRQGKGVVVISHDDRYFGVADRMIKLERGKVVPLGEVPPPLHAVERLEAVAG